MTARTTRRTALATLAGAAAAAAFAPSLSHAAMSSAAGIVAGGSLEGPNGTVQFSAFGSRINDDSQPDPILFAALTWHDPAGLDGGPLRLDLATVASYGPIEGAANERLLTGTATVNSDGGEVPFALRFVDAGPIGEAADSIRLVVGGAAVVDGTPVAGGDPSLFSYEVEGELATGNIEIIQLEM